METNDSNIQTARNIYGTNLLSRIVEGQTLYYMYNGHADVTALIDTTSSMVVATYYYDAFGNIVEQTGSVNNNITYAGYQYDSETGLYYLNARMYDPVTARFLQEDTYRGTADDPLSLNLYTYCVNNPLIYHDPTGHWPEWLDKLKQKASDTFDYVGDKISASTTYVANKASDTWNAATSNVSSACNYVKDNVVQPVYNVVTNVDKIVEEWDWDSTEPPLKKYGIPEIPSSGDITSNVASSLTGSLFGSVFENLDKVEKPLGATINERGLYQLVPEGSIANIKPFEKYAKKAAKVGTGLTIVTNTLDVANTWTADSGNTNKQRTQKTGIQLAGSVLSFGVGMETGKLAASGIAGVPTTGGVSLILVPVAVAIDYGASKVIEYGQNWVYSKLDIK